MRGLGAAQAQRDREREAVRVPRGGLAPRLAAVVGDGVLERAVGDVPRRRRGRRDRRQVRQHQRPRRVPRPRPRREDRRVRQAQPPDPRVAGVLAQRHVELLAERRVPGDRAVAERFRERRRLRVLPELVVKVRQRLERAHDDGQLLVVRVLGAVAAHEQRVVVEAHEQRRRAAPRTASEQRFVVRVALRERELRLPVRGPRLEGAAEPAKDRAVCVQQLRRDDGLGGRGQRPRLARREGRRHRREERGRQRVRALELARRKKHRPLDGAQVPRFHVEAPRRLPVAHLDGAALGADVDDGARRAVVLLRAREAEHDDGVADAQRRRRRHGEEVTHRCRSIDIDGQPLHS